MRTLISCCLLILAMYAFSSCARYSFVIRSGAPPTGAAMGHEDDWHSVFFYGLAESSGPYYLDQMCPYGWYEITTDTSLLNSLVMIATSAIYTPQSVTIKCTGYKAAIKLRLDQDGRIISGQTVPPGVFP